MTDDNSAGAMLSYALTIFVSAFLLFQVQPIIAKMIVPWFGGSAGVWTACLLFFQAVLLLGYLYAHGLVRYLRPHAQARLHVGLLAISVLFLPVIPRQSWKPMGAEEPTARILSLLLVTVGLPYFLLSTTGPLVQAWYAERRYAEAGGDSGEGGESTAAGSPKSFPYRLYALSNAGSMLALLSYPVAVEPLLTSRQQAWCWSAAYAGFVLLCGSVALRARGKTRVSGGGDTPRQSLAAQPPSSPTPDTRRPTPDPEREAGRPGWGLYLLWVALAACSSTLLLATTNHLTQNVAAIPFLWILPLSLYLLSFILCFGGKGWAWGKAFLSLPPLAIGGMAFLLSGEFQNASIKLIIPAFAVGLFLCCVVCHGELARLKPHPRYLTSFYLMVSLGGALGGIFVALIAPRVFNGYYELPVGLVFCAALALLTLYRDASQRWWDPSWWVLVGVTVALGFYLRAEIRQYAGDARLMARNFYGALRVNDPSDGTSESATRTLTNGTINHGEQFLSAKRRMRPTTYYGPDTGVGLAIRATRKQPQRVGVIGLGAGTLACYGRPGDVYRFYEINPLVLRLANTEFSFLKGSEARVEVVPGDARLSLEREPPEAYDVLAVDAFSSDAIPVHLLTREAFSLYFRHLKESGVLAVHVSNRYLDLEPVVARSAAAVGKRAWVIETGSDDAKDLFATTWVLVTGSPDFLANPLIKQEGRLPEAREHLRTWTDEYSNLYQVLQ